MSLCDKYFYKNKKSKLSFGDRIAVQNDILFKYGGSMYQTLIPFKKTLTRTQSTELNNLIQYVDGISKIEHNDNASIVITIKYMIRIIIRNT